LLITLKHYGAAGKPFPIVSPFSNRSNCRFLARSMIAAGRQQFQVARQNYIRAVRICGTIPGRGMQICQIQITMLVYFYPFSACHPINASSINE
jgi:hypothetical protein